MPLCFENFTAKITIESVELQPLEIHVKQESRTVICWLPSYEGETFTVTWSDEGSGFDTVAYIYLDGHPYSGRFLSGKGVTSRSGARTGHEIERPFMFAAAPASGSSSSDSQEAGSIILRIKRIKKTDYRLNNIRPLPSMESGDATDHRIGFGPEKQCAKKYPTTWNFKPYEPGEGAYVTFIWRYRPPEWLIGQGIVKAEHIPRVKTQHSDRLVIGRAPPPTPPSETTTDAGTRESSQSHRAHSQPAPLRLFSSSLPSPSTSSPVAGPSSAIDAPHYANPFGRAASSNTGLSALQTDSTKSPSGLGIGASPSHGGPQRNASSARIARASTPRSVSYSGSTKERRKNNGRTMYPGESRADDIRASSASYSDGMEHWTHESSFGL